MGLKFNFTLQKFLDLAEIEIAPITLIYGENSSGKSTIIECLRMIRQSGSSRINTSQEPIQKMTSILVRKRKYFQKLNMIKITTK